MVIRALNRFGLTKYILSDVPKPDDPTKAKQWRLNHTDIEEYLHAVVPGLESWANLGGLGWNVEDMGPKKTWDKLAQYYEKGSATSNFDMFNELTTIRRGSFDKVEAYQQRLNYLCQRLAGTQLKQTEEVYTWCALQGIAKEYPELHSRCLTNIQNNKLTWAHLMAEFQQLAVNGNARPAMTTVKIDSGKAITSTNKPNDHRNYFQGMRPVDVEGQQALQDLPEHFRGNIYWYCNTEQAPDWWKPKE